MNTDPKSYPQLQPLPLNVISYQWIGLLDIYRPSSPSHRPAVLRPQIPQNWITTMLLSTSSHPIYILHISESKSSKTQMLSHFFLKFFCLQDKVEDKIEVEELPTWSFSLMCEVKLWYWFIPYVQPIVPAIVLDEIIKLHTFTEFTGYFRKNGFQTI